MDDEEFTPKGLVSRTLGLLLGWGMFKCRHAIALAAVGWYLLSPPSSGNFGFLGNLQDRVFGPASPRPISQWTQLSAFDTAAKCAAAKLQAERGAEALCIATDDPRLNN